MTLDVTKNAEISTHVGGNNSKVCQLKYTFQVGRDRLFM